jgi:hypothetical protein
VNISDDDINSQDASTESQVAPSEHDRTPGYDELVNLGMHSTRLFESIHESLEAKSLEEWELKWLMTQVPVCSALESVQMETTNALSTIEDLIGSAKRNQTGQKESLSAAAIKISEIIATVHGHAKFAS